MPRFLNDWFLRYLCIELLLLLRLGNWNSWLRLGEDHCYSSIKSKGLWQETSSGFPYESQMCYKLVCHPNHPLHPYSAAVEGGSHIKGTVFPASTLSISAGCELCAAELPSTNIICGDTGSCFSYISTSHHASVCKLPDTLAICSRKQHIETATVNFFFHGNSCSSGAARLPATNVCNHSSSPQVQVAAGIPLQKGGPSWTKLVISFRFYTSYVSAFFK